MKQCTNCINRKECHKSGQMNSFAVFCFEHDMCSFEQDITRPKYSMEVAKQLIYDCAMDLEYDHMTCSRGDIADRLINIVEEIGKM